MKKIITLCAALALSGCVSVGAKIERSSLEEFHKGKTTYADVVAALGKPTQTYVTDKGDTTAIYSYFSAQPRPESFIPYVGAFVGGADMENSYVTLTFNKNGILTSYASSQGSMGSGHGFEAISQPRNTDQPRTRN